MPFDVESENGLALGHDTSYAWISSPSGVWRAGRGEELLDLSSDILVVKQQLISDSGELVIELQNNNGKYNSPGTGDLAAPWKPAARSTSLPAIGLPRETNIHPD